MENRAIEPTRVLVVNGSYRDDGITDQAVACATEALLAAGATVEVVELRDYPIDFCLNCRQCTQAPGEQPGRCVLDDGMHELIDRIERAQAFVLASPTNFGSVTALFKRFMERLVPYAYWPWGRPWPQFRKRHAITRKTLLISSSAAPGWFGRWLFGSGRQLGMTAKMIGARPVGLLFSGTIALGPDARLPVRTRLRARRLALRLID